MNITGFETHFSLGREECYHEPLPKTFRKIELEHQGKESWIGLSCAVKTMNDTHAPEGLVPPVLVFGKFTQVLTTSEDTRPRSSIYERVKVTSLAQKNMEK